MRAGSRTDQQNNTPIPFFYQSFNIYWSHRPLFLSTLLPPFPSKSVLNVTFVLSFHSSPILSFTLRPTLLVSINFLFSSTDVTILFFQRIRHHLIFLPASLPPDQIVSIQSVCINCTPLHAYHSLFTILRISRNYRPYQNILILIKIV